MKLHSINTEQRVYVMPCGDGFSCYGFDVLDRKARAVAEWMRAKNSHTAGVDARDVLRDWPETGTAAHFARCAAIMAAGADFNSRTGERCPAELVPAFIGREGERVECDYYGERVRFYIGKSTGWMPAHLRIRTRRSSGGEALSASAISNVRFI